MGRRALSQGEFVKKAKMLHNYAYSYQKTAYINMKTRVVVTCSKHGDFLILPSNHVRVFKRKDKQHLRPQGCPSCGRELTRTRNQLGRDSKETFINKSNSTHNHKYEYPSSYRGQNYPIEIMCYQHGLFNQLALNHLRGSGCPRCKNSKGQTKVAKILSKMGIKYETEHSFDDCRGDAKPLKFDFYVPTKNILIEYDGEQHFKPVRFHKNMTEQVAQEQFERTVRYDKIKNEYAVTNDIKLLRVKYNNLNIEQTIRNFYR